MDIECLDLHWFLSKKKPQLYFYMLLQWICFKVELPDFLKAV